MAVIFAGCGLLSESEMMEEIREIDSRLRKVEDAILEISLVAKYAKYGLMILGLSLGVDVSGMV